MTKTILIVDDSASMRQMLKFTLTGAGYAVQECGNGQQALDLVSAGRDGEFDLILTDLNMPVMDGLALTRAVRGLSGRTRFVPILVLTTESSPQVKASGKAAGATGWIVKPFQPAQLIQTLGKVLPS